MGVIVVVCSAFGLTVSGAKTETICLRTKGMPEKTTIFSVEAVGQMYHQTNEFVYPGELQPQHLSPICLSRSTGIYVTHGAALRKYTLDLYDRPSAPLELKTRMLGAEVQLRHVEPARVPIRHAPTSPPQLFDSLHRSARGQPHRPPDFLSRHPHKDGK